MKKLFTLAAAVLFVTGLWANQTDLISDVTLPDVPASSLDMATQTFKTADANGWIVMEPNGDIRNASVTWFTAMAWNTTSVTISDVSGFTAPFTTLSGVSCTTVRKTERTKAIRFTGADAISFLASSTGNDRTVHVALFSYEGGVQTLEETKNTGNAYAELLFSGLAPETDYIAYMYCSNGSNAVIAEIALKKHLCDDPNATIIADASGFVGDEIDLEFSSDNTGFLEWDVTLDGESAVGDQDYSWAADGVFKPQKPGTFVVTAEQPADGTHCSVAESVTLTIAEKTPVTEVTVAGPDAGFIGIPITLTATAEGATAFRWMDADNSVIPGATEATYTFTPDAAGTWKFNCQARNQFNVDGSDNPTWQPSDIKFITVTHASGELIKAELTSGSAATVTGVIGGTADVNLSSNKKMDKGKYFGITLAAGSFQEGDTVIITMTTAGGNYPCLFADKERTNCLFLAEEASSALEYRIILPAAATGLTSLYLARDADDANYKWNPVLSSISVVRPKFVKSSTETLTGVAIDGVGISAEAFEALIESHNWGTSKEYANAPTVVFTKHVVVTYEDDTTGERDEEVEVVAEDTGSNSFRAEATIGGINYIIITAKSTVYTVVFKDGETEIGSENVEVGEHPTAENIELPAKEFQSFAAWQKDGSDIALSDVSAAAGETITLVARYAKVYSQSINIEQIVLDEGTAYDIKAAFAAKGIVAVDVDALDTLNDLEKKDNRNYAFLGLKVKKNTSTIAVLLANNSTLRVKFGNVGNAVNVKIGDAEPVDKSAEDLADPFVYTNETGADIVVRFVSSGTKTVVFKQIMIDEAIAEVVLPAPSAYAITLEAGEHGTLAANWEGKTDKKVNVPVDATVTLTVTPAEGYVIGSVTVGDEILVPAEGVYSFVMPAQNVTVSATFKQLITNVALTAEFPKLNETVGTNSFEASVPDGAGYQIMNKAFFDNELNLLSNSYVLVAGTYIVEIGIWPKDGYAFPATPTDVADTEKITITVNGDAPHSTYGAWAGGPVLFVRAQFTVSDPTGIGNAEAEGKVVKTIENGQLMIIKNGVKYNAFGEMIK